MLRKRRTSHNWIQRRKKNWSLVQTIVVIIKISIGLCRFFQFNLFCFFVDWLSYYFLTNSYFFFHLTFIILNGCFCIRSNETNSMKTSQCDILRIIQLQQSEQKQNIASDIWTETNIRSNIQHRDSRTNLNTRKNRKNWIWAALFYVAQTTSYTGATLYIFLCALLARNVTDTTPKLNAYEMVVNGAHICSLYYNINENTFRILKFRS